MGKETKDEGMRRKIKGGPGRRERGPRMAQSSTEGTDQILQHLGLFSERGKSAFLVQTNKGKKEELEGGDPRFC